MVKHLPELDWTVVALPDRHFSWRMGGNAFNFAEHESLKQNYDVVLATSMVDLATLLAWFPKLHQAKKILYFHENQMVYPASQSNADLLHFQIRSIQSAVAADQLLFNSQYNQDSFLAGVKRLANQMPDGLRLEWAAELDQKSQVLPVPIDDGLRPTEHCNDKPWQVVWNHRWEHDKGPELLFEVMKGCRDLPLKFAVIGQQFRKHPQVFDQIKSACHDQISHWGYVEDRSEYLNILSHSYVVLSTAKHEFQGLAVAEAVALGCTPLLPNALVYPELYPDACLFEVNEHAADEIIDRLKCWLPSDRPSVGVESLRWQNLISDYQQLFKLLQ